MEKMYQHLHFLESHLLSDPDGTKSKKKLAGRHKWSFARLYSKWDVRDVEKEGQIQWNKTTRNSWGLRDKEGRILQFLEKDGNTDFMPKGNI